MTNLQLLLKDAIIDGAFPGAAYYSLVDGQEELGYIGRQTYCPDSPPIDQHTIWDLASLSKVISTTSLVMLAIQRGTFDLDWPVAKIIPEFAVNGKAHLTFRNLMVHNSGLIAFRAYYRTCKTREEVLAKIYAEELTYPTASKTVYSDLSMILVDEALRRVCGQTLDQQFRREIAMPLGLNQIGYFAEGEPTMIEVVNPGNCAPTERTEDWRRTLRRVRHGDLLATRLYGNDPEFIRAEVHDPTATAMGGVAGHAGLFATLNDLREFALNLILNRPKLFDRQVLETFTTRQSSQSTRALGWDTKSETGSSAGTLMGPKSFGHTGFTGTSIWIDPDAETIVVLLTNRVHPSAENQKLLRFRPQFHDTALKSSRSQKK